MVDRVERGSKGRSPSQVIHPSHEVGLDVVTCTRLQLAATLVFEDGKMNADMIVAATNILMAVATFFASLVALFNTEERRFRRYVRKQKCDLVLVIRHDYLNKTEFTLQAEIAEMGLYEDFWETMSMPLNNCFDRPVCFLRVKKPDQIRSAAAQLRMSKWFSEVYLTKEGAKKCHQAETISKA